MKVPKPIVCPKSSDGVPGAWRPSGDGPSDDCCESNGKRSPTVSCNVACAEAECKASSGTWVKYNYSVHPYVCCNAKRHA